MKSTPAIRAARIGKPAQTLDVEDLAGVAVVALFASTLSESRKGRALGWLRRHWGWASALWLASSAATVVLVEPPRWALSVVPSRRRRNGLREPTVKPATLAGSATGTVTASETSRAES